VNGREYHFRTDAEFQAMVERGDLLEHAEVFGRRYGTPRAPVETALDSGRDVLFDVDWQGGQQLRNSPLKDAVVSVFILPPSIAELERRLRARGQDSEEVIAARMARARDEISHWDAYDYVLINDDLDRCEDEVRAILAAERLKRERRPRLMGFVQRLNEEFQERCR
jgi:guanylate kinase